MNNNLKAICTKDYTVMTNAKSTAGEIFSKFYTIPKGATGTGTVESNRLMIRLDKPLTADNEDVAPYKSQLHRVFLYNDNVDINNWNII